jgi:hypothetical protein
MADKRISELTALAGASVADDDALAIVDTSATQTKKIVFSELKAALDTSTGFVRITGDTMTGDLSFGDDDKAIFGAGSDLEIFHDGSVSKIADSGVGNLDLQTNGTSIRLMSNNGTETMGLFNQNGSVDLYYDNAEKLTTTSTGVDITGNITATDLILDGGPSSSVFLQDSTATNGYQLRANVTSALDYGLLVEDLSGGNIARFDSGGDISFYEDTGTTAKLTWDASAESLNFADNGKAIFGAGSDLEIFHDGSHSYIKDVNTGNLYLRTEGGEIRLQGGSETMLRAFKDGGLRLYYDNAEKLRTEATGIDVTGTVTATAYNTSSDHRLKENVADVTDGITRVKQLAPKRFNFIADPDTTVDGFLAHEAQAVVPEAVTGTHNEVDADGNAVMQGIDQSKLVPLLTAALQEAISKIETLETKVAALEGA